MKHTPGVLALQGGFAAHSTALKKLGYFPRLVKAEQDLEQVDSLIIPGGESTVMMRLLYRSGFLSPLSERIRGGLPVFGTCAGMILLSSGVAGQDQATLGMMDYSIERNAYGRQINSFETTLLWDTAQIPAVFIRAPRIREINEQTEVLIRYEGDPVLVRQENCLAASFHPELTASLLVHRYFMEELGGRRIPL